MKEVLIGAFFGGDRGRDQRPGRDMRGDSK